MTNRARPILTPSSRTRSPSATMELRWPPYVPAGHSDGGQWTRMGKGAVQRNGLTPEQVDRLKWAYLRHRGSTNATDTIVDTSQRIDPETAGLHYVGNDRLNFVDRLGIASDAAQNSVAGASLIDVVSTGPTLGAQYANTRGFSIDFDAAGGFWPSHDQGPRSVSRRYRTGERAISRHILHREYRRWPRDSGAQGSYQRHQRGPN